MLRRLFMVCLTAGACVLPPSGSALAISPSKGLKVDTLLQQAITDTAESSLKDGAADLETRDIEEVRVELPVFGPPEDGGAASATEEEKPCEERMALEDETPVPEPEPVEPPPPAEEEKPKEPRKIGQLFNGLLFLPQLTVKQGWNSNLYAVETGKEADYITHFMPRVRVEIPDIRHDVAFDASYEYRKHWSHANEDQHNIRSKLGGALNASHGLSLPFAFVWDNTQEQREDDLAGQQPDEPLGADDVTMEGGLRFKPGSFGIGLLGHYQRQRYADGVARADLVTPIIRSDANRDAAWMEFHTSFDIDAENTLMLQGTYGDRDYQRQNFQGGGFTGPQRNSATFSGMVSWIFGYAGLNGHMNAGIQDYNYNDSTIEDVREFVGDVEIEHAIREDTTLNFQLARSIFEDVETIDPITRSRIGLYLDHQASDDFLVAAGMDYNFLAFHDPGGRNDEKWDFRVIGDYFLNDIWALGAEYSHTVRDSSVGGLDFGRNVIQLRLRGRL